ncbi:MAG: RNA polymerase sigma factor [Acidimicrobiales bacterium]
MAEWSGRGNQDGATTGPRCLAGGGRWSNWSDDQLLVAPLDIRQDAHAELYRRHSPSVLAAAGTILGMGSPFCDDVVAEVFAQLWCSPQRFEPERGSLRGFLRVHARGRSIDLLRAESRRQRREAGAPIAQLRVDPPSDERLLRAEACRELRSAVWALPETERSVVELAYFGGMTYRGVAQHLDLSEGTVKARIRTGLRRLRTQVITYRDAEIAGMAAIAPASAAGGR